MLGGWVDATVGDANSLQVVLGSTQTVVSNLILSPTDPTSLTLNITNGFLASLQPVDASAYGSLSADTNSVLQLGFNQQTAISIGNDLEAGQAQFVLVQAGFEQIDSNSQVLPYVNLSNPAVPYNGPSNSGVAQDTVRNAVAVISLVPGTPATSGDEVAPTVSAGCVALAYVDLQAGQTTISADQILNPDNVAGGSPSAVLAGLLNSHHSGAVGQAPKVQLGTSGPIPQEVQGELPMANLFASNVIGAVTAFRTGSGNPNGVLAGNANRNGVCDSYYDVTNNAFYFCTTTGSTSTAVWTSTNIPSSHQINTKVFSTSGSYTPTSGTKYIAVAVCGGGGGGSGSNGATDQGETGGAGGGGGTALALLPTNGLTFPATVTVGTGGAGGYASGDNANTSGVNGNNSQFSTTEISTSLTGYAGEGGLYPSSVPDNVTPQGGRGGGALQSAALMGTITISAVAYPYLNVFGSPGACGPGDAVGVGPAGGASMFGGGGIGGFLSASPVSPGGGIGSGGGAAGFDNAVAKAGGNGQNGLVLVIEYVGN
jgi:hypothetical protein